MKFVGLLIYFGCLGLCVACEKTEDDKEDTDSISSDTDTLAEHNGTEHNDDSSSESTAGESTDTVQDIIQIEWIQIPGGSFEMGSEDPDLIVDVPVFEMTQREITQGQYRNCVNAGSCTLPETVLDANYMDYYWNQSGYENHPIVGVSWYQADSFCQWSGARLPSNAEWEYAAKNAGKDVYYTWGSEQPICEFAVMDDCNTDLPMEGCSKPSGITEHGVCDMLGNVSEWIQDRYHPTYEGAPTDGSAWEKGGNSRIHKGGCYLSDDNWDGISIYHRNYYPETMSWDTLGFRCAR